MPQFVRQITGDMRLTRPSIKVVPVDNGADREIARVRAGLIRYVENRSDAQAAYCHGADQQVAAGIGHWRVIKEYADDTTFNQELRIVAVEDGLSRDLGRRRDPAEQGGRALVLRAGGHEPRALQGALAGRAGRLISPTTPTAVSAGWCGADFVRVCEYWVKKPATRLLALLPSRRDRGRDRRRDAKAARYEAQGIRVESARAPRSAAT